MLPTERLDHSTIRHARKLSLLEGVHPASHLGGIDPEDRLSASISPSREASAL